MFIPFLFLDAFNPIKVFVLSLFAVKIFDFLNIFLYFDCFLLVKILGVFLILKLKLFQKKKKELVNTEFLVMGILLLILAFVFSFFNL